MPGSVEEHAPSQTARFASAKFCPVGLPGTLVCRSVLLDRLSAGAG
jgi:hypothetical protein